MKRGRIVVRIEIEALMADNGKLSHDKLDRLAMILSNLHNSGKDILVVTSGAIALGADKLSLTIDNNDIIGMMAAAAIGQAELIKLYQRYFDQYNQMVAQVLVTADVMKNQQWKENTQTTFETLLSMNIIPIINENDAVSTSDIELDDNYPLALNVAKICKADIIMVKSDTNGKYLIQPRNNTSAVNVSDEKDLFVELDQVFKQLNGMKGKVYSFPESMQDINLKATIT